MQRQAEQRGQPRRRRCATRTDRSRTSLKLSISCSRTSSSSTGSERDGDVHRRILSENIASRRGAAAVLERDGCRRTTASCPGSTGREPEVELPAEAGQRRGGRRALSTFVVRPVDEHRRPQPRRVEARRAEPRGTATAAGSTRPCPSRSCGRRSRSARRRESCRRGGSASRRDGRRSCCRTRRRRSWRTAESRSRGENPAAVRSQIDEWPSGSADAAIERAVQLRERRRRRRRRCCSSSDHLRPVSSST